MAKWIKISERKPKKFEDILICVSTPSGSEVMMGYYTNSGDWFCYNYDTFIKAPKVSHWMPLPDLPTVKETVGEALKEMSRLIREVREVLDEG